MIEATLVLKYSEQSDSLVVKEFVIPFLKMLPHSSRLRAGIYFQPSEVGGGIVMTTDQGNMLPPTYTGESGSFNYMRSTGFWRWEPIDEQ